MNVAHRAPSEEPVDMSLLQDLSKVTGYPIHMIMSDLGIVISRCSTIEKTILQYYAAKEGDDGEQISASLLEWSRLSLEEVAKASTIEEIKRIHDQTPPTDARQAALDRWTEMVLQKLEGVQTIEEAKEIYNKAPIDGHSKYEILQKWNKIAFRQVEEASTIEEMKTAYETAPEGSRSQQAAIGKWARNCKTSRELREVYDASLNGPCESDVLRLLNEMSERNIQECKSVLDVRGIYDLLPPASIDARKLAIQTMCRLHSEFRGKEKPGKA